MTEERKPTYIGLWTKEDKNGNPFLSGSEDDVVYFVFRDRNDKKTLHTIDKRNDPEAKLVKVGTLESGENERGPYQRLDNMFIFKNERREKDTHPHFNLVIYNTEEA